MPAPRKVPSLAELQGKLQDKLPAEKQPSSTAAGTDDTSGPPERIGRLNLPRRPSLGLIRSQSAISVPSVATMPEAPLKNAAPPAAAPALSRTTSEPAQSDGVKKGEHKLKHQWTLYADSKHDGTGRQASDSYSLNRIDSFQSVESFARLFNHLKRPSKLPDKANVAMFKDGIEPTWEAEGNQGGGTWTLFLNSDQSVDLIFSEAALALVGSQLPDEELCGLVINRRNRGDRVHFWTRTTDKTLVDPIASAFTSKLAIHSPGLKYRTEFRAHEQAAKKAAAPPTRNRPSRMPLQRASTTPSFGTLPINHNLPASPAKHNGLGFAAFAQNLPDANGPVSLMGRSASYRPPLSPAASTNLRRSAMSTTEK